MTNQLVLSLFPGVGLFDLAFQEAGFSIVRGPDLIHGADVTEWPLPPADRFDGIIAGPPCQGFSVANSQRHNPSHPSVRHSVAMLELTARIISHCRPLWALVENVPTVPDLQIPGYARQRIAINDFECGGDQVRWRAIQFFSRDGFIIRPQRVNDRSPARRKGRRPESITTKPTSRHQTYREQCRRQGLSEPIELPGWSREARFRAIGNGVPLPIGRVLAAAVREAMTPANDSAARVGPPTEFDCICGCGRDVAGGIHRSATPACRKRLQLSRASVRMQIIATKNGSADRDSAGPLHCTTPDSSSSGRSGKT